MPLTRTRHSALERAGWKVGTVSEFLQLTPNDAAFIEIKLALARDLGRRRRQKHLTQVQLARRLKTSQSRVAKMEAAHPSVSLDLLIRSLFELGVTRRTLARIISSKSQRAA